MRGSNEHVLRPAAAVTLGELRWSVAIDNIACDADARLCEAVSVERRYSVIVQLIKRVLTAAEHAADAWEAAVSTCCETCCGCGTRRAPMVSCD